MYLYESPCELRRTGSKKIVIYYAEDRYSMWHIQQQKQYIWCFTLNYILLGMFLCGGKDRQAAAG